MADKVKAEFLHAWNGYKPHCWGHDDLKPISKTCRDWYGQSILMTPVDSLDSLYLLGFKNEADKTREYIVKNLSFDKDISVQNFEITIRILGGLLSSYQMTGDKRLLALADDLGTRLLACFRFANRIAVQKRKSQNGKDKREVSNPAETGTLLIEFGTLSKLTESRSITKRQNGLWSKPTNAVRRSDWSEQISMSRPGSGPTRTATFQPRSTRITNTCSRPRSCLTIRNAETCGRTRYQRSIHILPTRVTT